MTDDSIPRHRSQRSRRISLPDNGTHAWVVAPYVMTNPNKPQQPETEKREPLDFPGYQPADEDPVGEESKPEPGPSTADEIVDRESEDSFPASDPPSTTPLTAGEPDKNPEPKVIPDQH